MTFTSAWMVRRTSSSLYCAAMVGCQQHGAACARLREPRGRTRAARPAPRVEVDARSRGTRTALPCENVPKGEGFSPKKEHTPTAHSESANILEISSCQVENQNQRVKYFREAKLTDRGTGQRAPAPAPSGPARYRWYQRGYIVIYFKSQTTLLSTTQWQHGPRRSSCEGARTGNASMRHMMPKERDVGSSAPYMHGE